MKTRSHVLILGEEISRNSKLYLFCFPDPVRCMCSLVIAFVDNANLVGLKTTHDVARMKIEIAVQRLNDSLLQRVLINLRVEPKSVN
jgi:hypothetical protein